MQKVLIVDNVRSVLNVGSLFRTANGLGIRHIILCGITPTPLDKKGIKRKDFAKVALGSEEMIVWEYREFVEDVVKELKENDFFIISLEQGKKSVHYRSIVPQEKTAVVVGSEVDGVSSSVLELSHKIAEIPMLGLKESLNVTIAFAVLGYSLFDTGDLLRKN